MKLNVDWVLSSVFRKSLNVKTKPVISLEIDYPLMHSDLYSTSVFPSTLTYGEMQIEMFMKRMTHLIKCRPLCLFLSHPALPVMQDLGSHRQGGGMTCSAAAPCSSGIKPVFFFLIESVVSPRACVRRNVFDGNDTGEMPENKPTTALFPFLLT